jgi:hypothetical protein
MVTIMFADILTKKNDRLKASSSRLRPDIHAIFVGFIFICMLLPGTPLFAGEQAVKATASDLKAAYIFNFIRFAEWPDSAREKTRNRLLINVLNDRKLHDVLKNISKKAVGRQMKLEVQSCSTEVCIKQSSIIFIGQSDGAEYHQLLKSLGDKPVLTISDIPEFATTGGMIEIRQTDKKMAFVINLDTVKQADLYISSQLLQLANVITGEKLQLAIVSWGL